MSTPLFHNLTASGWTVSFFPRYRCMPVYGQAARESFGPSGCGGIAVQKQNVFVCCAVLDGALTYCIHLMTLLDLALPCALNDVSDDGETKRSPSCGGACDAVKIFCS